MERYNENMDIHSRMIPFRHLGLFEGIGGFSLAAEWMGWETVAWCEINEFCQKILKYHFPNAIGHGDIKTTDFTIHRGTIDILTGGDPCQPSSVAGKRKGKDDDRYLWPEMYRAIRESKPNWIVNENVPGTISNGILDQKISDLETEGYTCWPPFIIPASAVGAWHKRERVWLVANSAGMGRKQRTDIRGKIPEEIGRSEPYIRNITQRIIPDPEIKGLEGTNAEREIPANGRTLQYVGSDRWTTEPGICGVAYGIPDRVDRIKALGNAIVPQIAYQIFKAIEQTELLKNNL